MAGNTNFSDNKPLGSACFNKIRVYLPWAVNYTTKIFYEEMTDVMENLKNDLITVVDRRKLNQNKVMKLVYVNLL